MELVAAIIVIGLALAGAWYVATLVVSNETARFVIATAMAVVAVVSLWVVLDADSNTVGATIPAPAGHAGNAGPVPTTGPGSMGSTGQ